MKYIKLFEKVNVEYVKLRTNEPYFSASLKKIPIRQQEYLLTVKKRVKLPDFIFIPTKYNEFDIGFKFWSSEKKWFEENEYIFKGDILTPDEIEKCDTLINSEKYNL